VIPPQLFDDHRRALADVLATFRSLDEAQWATPRAGGKWSPALIAEHLRLTYVVSVEEARGGQGMRQRAPWYLAPILRLRYLRGILRRGRFPEGAPAVREIRPGEAAVPAREPLLAALATEGERLLAAVAAADRNGDRRRMTHPFFGKLDLATGLQLGTAHLRHHEAQVREVVAATAAAVEART
jgi:hypothetical protein